MKARIVSITLAVLSLALAAYCVYVCYAETGVWWQALLFAVAEILCVPLCDLLHESGHFLFGATVKIKAQPDKIAGLKFWQPSNCKIMAKTDENLKGKLIFTVFGGIAVNLIFVILGVLTLCISRIPVWCAVTMPASFYLFAFNALPLYVADEKCDGLVISELIKGDDGATVMLAVLKAQAQLSMGKTYLQLDEKLLFDLPQIREDDISFIALTELRYEYCKAKGDVESADKYEKRLRELEQYL